MDLLQWNLQAVAEHFFLRHHLSSGNSTCIPSVVMGPEVLTTSTVVKRLRYFLF
jgi:hypothetical protein